MYIHIHIYRTYLIKGGKKKSKSGASFFFFSFSPWTLIVLPLFICVLFSFSFFLLLCCLPSFLAFGTSFFFLCLRCVYLWFRSSVVWFLHFGFSYNSFHFSFCFIFFLGFVYRIILWANLERIVKNNSLQFPSKRSTPFGQRSYFFNWVR